MKKITFSLIAMIALTLNVQADVITLWTFDNNPPDTSVSTGTNAPAQGNGTALLVGGTTATFASGITSGNNDSGWNTTSYPAQGINSRTAGVRFNVSTLGHTNITVSFQQRLSNTPSKHYRFQYTTNGTDFIDGTVITMTLSNTFQPQAINLAGVEGVHDNPNFGFRVVSEFEFTATGAGTNGYVTPSVSAYSATGTVRFDTVTVSGDLIDIFNEAPSITDTPDQTISENGATGDIPFQAGDFETPSDALTYTATSSNTELVPNASIILGGSDINRTVNITPASNQYGTAVITIRVTDPGSLFTSDSFVLTVLPLNAAPAISSIPAQSTLVNVATPPLLVTVSDFETPAQDLILTAASSNPELVPSSGIVFGGSGTDRTITVTPASGKTGTAVITVTVSDGVRSGSTVFNFMVVPSAEILLCETFSYADGSLLANSAHLWVNHDGIAGQLSVTAGRVRLTSAQNEDVHASLAGGPYAGNSGAVLYSSFTVNFSTLPTSGGEYFTHYNHNSNFRGRVYANTANAAAGTFRLGIGNGTANFTQWPGNLSLGSNYTVVTRFDLGVPASTLWVNPANELAASVSATDTVAVVTIASHTLRQNASIGTMTIDDLKIGTSFASVTGIVSGPQLQIAVDASGVQICWPASADGYVLQNADSLSAAAWTRVEGEPVIAGDKKVVRFENVTGPRFFRLIRSGP